MIHRLKILLGVGGLLFLLSPASAATLSVTNGEIRIEGTIASSTSALLVHGIAEAIVNQNADAIDIRLDSPGGDIDAALEMADALKSASAHIPVRTTVGPKARCLSACTVVFAAGAERSAHASARFLFHGVAYRGVRDGRAVEKDIVSARTDMVRALSDAAPSFIAFLDRNGVFESATGALFTAGEIRRMTPEFLSLINDTENADDPARRQSDESSSVVRNP